MFKDLPENLKKLLEDKNTIPPAEKVFRAFSYFQPKDCKVIIIGQDPYPDKFNACGLAFSVEHNKIPGSLRNIFKELCKDIKCKKPKTGNLEKWAEQGVLLLNPVLTTRNGQIKAHSTKGWQEYTKDKINKILALKRPLVIIAWGKEAQTFVSTLSVHSNTKIITGAHPSPLSAHKGFFKGKYFSKANEYLISKNITPIDWTL
jgi:uracil-DNA glycosylase